ncbi:hypothetical protein [Rheinheimera metallidurans]
MTQTHSLELYIPAGSAMQLAINLPHSALVKQFSLPVFAALL